MLQRTQKKKYATQGGKGTTASLVGMAAAAKKIEKKFGKSRPIDDSINIDHYLYGAPKKKV